MVVPSRLKHYPIFVRLHDVDKVFPEMVIVPVVVATREPFPFTERCCLIYMLQNDESLIFTRIKELLPEPSQLFSTHFPRFDV